MIFDTNVLIHLSKRTLSPHKIFLQPAKISVITKIETLGYRFDDYIEHEFLVNLCNELEVIALTDEIAERTIELRSTHKIKLPDALIYTTALVEELPLPTNNINDFIKLGGRVQLIDPFTL